MIRLLAGFLLLAAPLRLEAQARHEFTELHMGMAVRVVLYATDTAAARTAARAAYDRIAELEDIFSDYRPTSEVRQLESHAGEWTPVSPELIRVLRIALLVSALTDGAFDPTAAPLTTLWRNTRSTGQLPAPADLAAARALVGWRDVHLDGAYSTVLLGRPGMRLDLGGVAKGFILGEALAVLRSRGLPQALLEAGGDIVVGAAPPGRPGWDIGVAGMDPGPLSGAAVATSGSSEQFVEINGTRYGHIVDPTTGLGVTSGYQATVIGPDPATADALATALVVLGPGGLRSLLAGFPGYRGVVTVAGTP